MCIAVGARVGTEDLGEGTVVTLEDLVADYSQHFPAEEDRFREYVKEQVIESGEDVFVRLDTKVEIDPLFAALLGMDPEQAPQVVAFSPDRVTVISGSVPTQP